MLSDTLPTQQWTPDALRRFEKDIALEFELGHIKAPVHLAGGNEEKLIDIFASIDKDDWVLCSWRSHLHCLLHGVPAHELKRAILAGRSIALCFPQHRILSSAIVGGICPIAVGIAMGIRKSKSHRHVHAFVGDMTSETGIFHECHKYAANHNLPVRFIVEDNGKSVMTDTDDVWGLNHLGCAHVVSYKYYLSFPHVGIGRWVSF